MGSKSGMNNEDDRLEVLEFTVGGRKYGIDTEDVTETRRFEFVKPVPNTPFIVEGITRLQDATAVIIDLKRFLQDNKSDDKGLIMQINTDKEAIGFHVESILGICDVYQDKLLRLDSAVSSAAGWTKAVIMDEKDQMIPILNPEKIISQISAAEIIQAAESGAYGLKNRSDVPILIVEDSTLLKMVMVRSLEKAGYANFAVMDNDREAWDYIQECRRTGSVSQKIQCVITDIEIPEVDGFRLTQLIKSDEELKNIPVIIFSALLNEETKARLKELGADAQMSKPEIGSLAETIDRLVNK